MSFVHTSLVLVGLIGLSAPAALAQSAPGWSRGQQSLAISYEECLRRAPLALRDEGFRIDHGAGNFAVGTRDPHVAVIMCNPASDGRLAVNIVVASNGGGGGEARVALQRRMELSEVAPPPPPIVGGGNGCVDSVAALALPKTTFRPGEPMPIYFRGGGVVNQRDWIGIYPAGAGPRGQFRWEYASNHVASGCTVTNMVAPTNPGTYEIGYLLNDGYDVLTARTTFTVVAN